MGTTVAIIASLVGGQLSLTPPHKLPIFDFLSELAVSNEVRTGQLGHVSSQGDTINPAWYYTINLSGTIVAHKLKQFLKKSDGWDLRFPDQNLYWQARAVHTTKGHIDWHIETESQGLAVKRSSSERRSTLLVIWDESRQLRGTTKH